MEDLKEKTQNQIQLKVDYPDWAIPVLEEAFGDIQYYINQNKEIVITNHIDKIDSIAHMMIENNLKVSKINTNVKTLEEYYLELIGEGERNNG